MIIESGVIIFLGMLFLAWKLPLKVSLWLLGHALAVDVAISFVAYMLHWGTFTGVMAAAVAGLMCSGFTTVAKWLFGHIRSGKYHPGVVDLSHRAEMA